MVLLLTLNTTLSDEYLVEVEDAMKVRVSSA